MDIQAPGTATRTLTAVGASSTAAKFRPLIFLDEFWGSGGSSTVHKSTSAGLVIKFSQAGNRSSLQALNNEAAIYAYLTKRRLPFIPQFLGLYKWPGGLAVLLSDEGTSLADDEIKFNQLMLAAR